MIAPTGSPATWTPEQTAEAMLSIALDAVPTWAERAWMLTIMARDSAPEGQAEAWMQAVKEAFTTDYAGLCERIVATVRATVGLTPDQIDRFAHEVAATMERRLAELAVSGLSHGGSA